MRNCKGVILLYDITSRESFEEVNKSYNDVRDVLDNPVITLVGNKLDLDYERYVTTEEGQRFADEHNLLFYEVSAKNGTNVNECFNTLFQRIYDNDPNKEEKRRIFQLINNRPPKRGCLKQKY